MTYKLSYKYQKYYKLYILCRRADYVECLEKVLGWDDDIKMLEVEN